MPNLTGIRDVLVTHLEEGWAHAPLIPVFYENAQTINEDAIEDSLLYCEIDFVKASQIDISATPVTRNSGDLILTVLTRETKGTRHVLELLDELAALFGYKALYGVYLGAPEVRDQRAPPGWYCKSLRIPFFADTTS